MTRDQLCIAVFVKLAKFAERRNVSYSVLSGYDSESGNVGRDLDIYVSSRGEALAMIDYFYHTLEALGAPWVVVVDPIWGFRCFGVTAEFHYVELHIFTTVRVGPFVVSDYYSLEAKQGALGLRYDPLFMLTKQILTKYNRRIAQGKALWESEKPPNTVCRHRTELAKRVSYEFVDTLLGPDNPETIRGRRVAFFKFMLPALWRPKVSIKTVVKGLWRRHMLALLSPCVPTFTIYFETSLNKDNVRWLEEGLNSRLGPVFPKVNILTAGKCWFYKKRMQSRQILLVFICEMGRIPKFHTDEKIKVDGGAIGSEKAMNYICESVMDATVQFNRKWHATYQISDSRCKER